MFRPSLFGLSVCFLWIKTYIAYQTSFEISIDNWLQAFILFINPLSFLLLFLGISLLLKNRQQILYLLSINFILTVVLLANIIFYRFFSDFITLPVLFQTSNMTDLGGSIKELINYSDCLYFADFFILLFFIHRKQVTRSYTSKQRKVFTMLVLCVTCIHLGMAELARPQLLTRSFDREMLVKNIGTYHYHLYDAYLQSKTSAQRALADGSRLTDIENYIQANQKEPNQELFGAASGKNIIMVSMESLQNFVIGERMNGEEITPFLNEFIKESYYFTDFYQQTGQGKTSDSEFLVENSLYPLGRGAVFFTHAQNTFQAAPAILNKAGYYTAALHANNKSFWNRDLMYQSLGYQHFYDNTAYQINSANSVNWGLKDKPFFKQSIAHLKSMPEPFYAKFITLTNHFPFTLDREDRSIPEYTSASRTLNRYFPTVRYMDEAIEQFITDLKETNLYEHSVIILYGDHYGISDNHNESLEQFLQREITPFEMIQLQRVPLVIHLPGQTGQTIDKVSGQIDLEPTILHLLGLETENKLQFGNDLFAEDKLDFAVLRNGSFITSEYVFTRDTCYEKETGELIDISHCEPFMDKANQELSLSDQLVQGDLLRFYLEGD